MCSHVPATPQRPSSSSRVTPRGGSRRGTGSRTRAVSLADAPHSWEKALGRSMAASRATTSVCSAGGESQWQPGVRDSSLAGAVSAAGRSMGSTKENQDSSFILQRADAREDGFLCGVIDGHGADGHLVSEFIRQNLAPSIIRERRAQSAGGTRAAMVRGFVGTAAKLKGVRDVDATESGAAVSVCMKRGKDLYVANVGDTRAVMACLDERGKAHG